VSKANKRSGKSGRKGSANERKKAKEFGLFLYGSDCLYRTHGSGSVRRGSHNYSGDIAPLPNSHVYFPFHMELKKGYDWQLQKVIRGRKDQFMDFWIKAEKDREDTKKDQPFIILFLSKDREYNYAVCDFDFIGSCGKKMLSNEDFIFINCSYPVRKTGKNKKSFYNLIVTSQDNMLKRMKTFLDNKSENVRLENEKWKMKSHIRKKKK
jgi:hypothetical protein